MRTIAIVAVLSLASCATVPAPKIVTHDIPTPVAVACIDRSAIPAEPGAVMIPLDARLAADTAAAQALAYKSYARQLLALLQPCIR